MGMAISLLSQSSRTLIYKSTGFTKLLHMHEDHLLMTQRWVVVLSMISSPRHPTHLKVGKFLHPTLRMKYLYLRKKLLYPFLMLLG